MIKCPKCGKELPDGTAFCLDCFTSLIEKPAEAQPLKKTGRVALFFKSKNFRIVCSAVATLAVTVTGALLMKRYIKPTVTVAADDTTLVEVTDENGEAVTDESGEAVMAVVVEVTDKNGEAVTNSDGSKKLQTVVPVTNRSGEAVTSKDGQQVFEVVTQSPSPTESTTKKGLFSKLFGDDNQGDNNTTTAAQSSTATEKPEETTAKPTTQPTTQPVTQPATSAVTNTSDFSFKDINGKILITSYNGNAKNVVVPTHVDSKEVTYIGVGAFKNNSNIESITFKSITEGYGRILYFMEGGAVFDNLPNLTSIHLAYETDPSTFKSDFSGVNNVDNSRIAQLFNNLPKLAHLSSDPKSINPNNNKHGQSVISASDNLLQKVPTLIYCPPAYENTTLVIPENITTIGISAFKDCKNLKSIIIHNNVKKIDCSFSTLDKLESITVSDSNSTFASCDGVLFNTQSKCLEFYPKCKSNKSWAVPESFSGFDINLNRFCSNPYLETLTVPECKILKVRGSYVPNNLKTVRIPENDPNYEQNRNYLSQFYSVETY